MNPTPYSAAVPPNDSLPVWIRRGLLTLLLAAGVAAGLVGYQHRDSLRTFFDPPPPAATPPREDVVRALGPSLIAVTPETPLAKKLVLAPVVSENISAPILTVTGSVITRLAPGKDEAESRWDFATPEIGSAYGDWVNKTRDLAFAEGQRDRIKDLNKAILAKVRADVTRWEKLVGIGTEARRDLEQARADEKKAEIQASKDEYEAENAVRAAKLNRGLLERTLFQQGIDAEAVARGKDGLVLVVADVPEAKIPLVKEGQPCEAVFYSFPGVPYPAKVGRIGPSVSRERRTLRVTVELHDRSGRLLPGMFAEIGLGTEPRDVLTVPADAVLHLGKRDYVLVASQPMEENAPLLFRVCAVQAGETLTSPGADPNDEQRARVVITGVDQGDRVVAAGAILLKPAVDRALNSAPAEVGEQPRP